MAKAGIRFAAKSATKAPLIPPVVSKPKRTHGFPGAISSAFPASKVVPMSAPPSTAAVLYGFSRANRPIPPLIFSMPPTKRAERGERDCPLIIGPIKF